MHVFLIMQNVRHNCTSGRHWKVDVYIKADVTGLHIFAFLPEYFYIKNMSCVLWMQLRQIFIGGVRDFISSPQIFTASIKYLLKGQAL